jgi:nucleoside-diphosphate-sugar epimerase
MQPTATDALQQHIVVIGRGQIGTPLVSALLAQGHAVTWLSRSAPSAVPVGVTHHALDACDPVAVEVAARGARAVIAAVNPAVYDAAVWARELPPLFRGIALGTRRAGARLVMLDALYAYALDEGPLRPSTREAPTTKKGAVRKQLADLVRAAAADGLRATILRAPDFWGPALSSALLTAEAIAGLRRGKRPMLLGNPDATHAFAHRDDVVDALIRLALADADVEGKVFHAPVIHTSPRALVGHVAQRLGAQVKPVCAPRWLLACVGLFSPSTRGLLEMLPQWEQDYLVDDTDFCARFGVEATTLEAGAAALAGAQTA